MPRSAIFLFGNESNAFAMANTCLQLRKFDFLESIILCIKTNNTDLISALKSIDDRINIRSIRESEIYDRLSFNYKENIFIKMYSEMPFARFFSFEYIDTFDNIVIADSDMVFQDGFEGILENLGEGGDQGILAWHKANPLNKRLNFDIDDSYTYPNGGLICINKSILKYVNNPIQELFSYVNMWHNRPSIDEFVWGYLSYKFNIPVKVLDPKKFNVAPFRVGSSQSAIVHGSSKYKFWRRSSIAFLFPQWLKCNDEWSLICKDHNLPQFAYRVEMPIWTEATLIAFDFSYEMYRQVWNCDIDLIPRLMLNQEFLKIHIRNLSEDIHLEVSRRPNTYLLQLHDENHVRNKSDFAKRIFSEVRKFYPAGKLRPDMPYNRFAFCVEVGLQNLRSSLIDFYLKIKPFIELYSKFVALINADELIAIDKMLREGYGHGVLIDGKKISDQDIANLGITLGGCCDECFLICKKHSHLKNFDIYSEAPTVVVVDENVHVGDTSLLSTASFNFIVVSRDSNLSNQVFLSKNKEKLPTLSLIT